MNPIATSPVPAPSTRFNMLLYWLTTAAAVLILALTGLTLIPAVIDPSLRDLAATATIGGPEVSFSVGPEIRYLSSDESPELTILWSTRIVAFLIQLAHASVLAYGLFAAARLFRRFADGLAFSPETGRLLRRVGFALLAHLLLGSPVNTLMVLAATWHGPGEHVLTVGMGLSGEGVLMALMAGLIIALGHVLHDAARLADDHRQIV